MWLVIILLLLSSVHRVIMVTVDLECQPGWVNVGINCYRVFSGILPWDSAEDVCLRYGARLLRTKDFRGNDAIGTIVLEGGATEIWIAYSGARIPVQTVTQIYPQMKSSHVYSDGDPNQCVLARIMDGHVVWAHAPCERKSAYVCQRPAAPSGCFHCTNGHHVQQEFTCDGDDDCGDGSDEINCHIQCTHHLTGYNGSVTSPGYPNGYPSHANCLWLIEVPLGYNARLQLTNFSLEPDENEVIILAGGMTLATSDRMARLSGDLSDDNDDNDHTYTSKNNLLIVSFRSASKTSHRGFSAKYTAVKAGNFPAHKFMPATQEPRDLFSPFYPTCLSSQDYTWVITAQLESTVVTLEIVDIDLMGDDRLLIRDGSSVYHPLLALMTSSYDGSLSHVQSTGRHLYITMQTRGMDTGRGFHFTYWEGCSMSLSGVHGSMVSPGYLLEGGRYPENQTCIYDVTMPDSQTVTIRFQAMDLDPSDHIVIYEGKNQVCNLTGTSLPPPIDISFGSFRLLFRSDVSSVGRGFALSYSIGCPKHHVNSRTAFTPETHLPRYQYGTTVTFSCSQGYAFPSDQQTFQVNDSITLECLPGGVWNASITPTCKPFCPPGRFYDVEGEECQACPVGKYQPLTNASHCQACPFNTTTKTPGASSSTDCKKSCSPGKRNNGTVCVPCSVGYYQDKAGQFGCKQCPIFKTTSAIGADSVTLCSVDVLDKTEEKDIDSEGLMIVRMRHVYRQAATAEPAQSHLTRPRVSSSTLVLLDRLRDVQGPSDLFSLAEEFGYSRHKREVAIDEEEHGLLYLGSGSGSGDFLDPCFPSDGSTPCNKMAQKCEPTYDMSSYTCRCVAGYIEKENKGDKECLEIPESQRLYLTTPLNLSFDHDLSIQSSDTSQNFRRDCEEALNDVFGKVEGFESVQVLEFREGAQEITIIFYSLRFTVEVSKEMRIKVAQTVLAMEDYTQINIGDKNYTFAGNTNIYDTKNVTASAQAVNWCSHPSLYECSEGKVCEDHQDGDVRYTCRCPDGYSAAGNSCVSISSIVGGIMAALVLLAVIAVVLFFIRRRRKKRLSYKNTEGTAAATSDDSLFTTIPLQENPSECKHVTYTKQRVGDKNTTDNPSNRIESEEEDKLSPYDLIADDSDALAKPSQQIHDTTTTLSVYRPYEGLGHHRSDSHTYKALDPNSAEETSIYDSTADDRPQSHVYDELKQGERGAVSPKHPEEVGYYNVDAARSGTQEYENMAMGGSASKRHTRSAPGSKGRPEANTYANSKQ